VVVMILWFLLMASLEKHWLSVMVVVVAVAADVFVIVIFLLGFLEMLDQ
jgi:hypothetical protein